MTHALDVAISNFEAGKAIGPTLDLSGFFIGDEGIERLVPFLSKPCGVTSLDLWGNRLGHQGARHLAQILQRNGQIVSLDLAGNEVGPMGADHLAAALRSETCGLRSLNLRGNHILNQGANAMAFALQENATLTSLYLWGNEISDGSAASFATALEKNTTLQEFDLMFMDFRIERLLRRNRAMTTPLLVLTIRACRKEPDLPSPTSAIARPPDRPRRTISLAFTSHWPGKGEILLEADPSQACLPQLCVDLARKAGVAVGQLRLALPDGRQLTEADQLRPLGEILVDLLKEAAAQGMAGAAEMQEQDFSSFVEFGEAERSQSRAPAAQPASVWADDGLGEPPEVRASMPTRVCWGACMTGSATDTASERCY